MRRFHSLCCALILTACGSGSEPGASLDGAPPSTDATIPSSDQLPATADQTIQTADQSAAVGNSGKPCTNTSQCSMGDTCIMFSGWTQGYCGASRAKSGATCPAAKTGQYASCLVSDAGQTQWWCLYLCQHDGQSFACPDPTQQCVEAEPGLKVCQPKGSCTPSCSGKQCGGDGCGGSCGTCPSGKTCTAGQCTGSTGNDPAGVDRSTCTGVSSATGSVSGVTPKVTQGSVLTDSSSGGLKLALLPASLQPGSLAVVLYFTPIAGQLSYPPTGATGCAVLSYTGSGWSVVDKSQMCDFNFAQIKHASSPGTCDGTIAGSFTGIFSGNQPLGATFYLPSNIAASQIATPSCLPTDSPCSSSSQCCSKSCAPYLGLCY